MPHINLPEGFPGQCRHLRSSPAGELMSDPRSGIGLFSRRNDIAALAIVFGFE
jgi:hypothetical protein